MPKIKKQFDCVIMNPPYQPPKKRKEESGSSSGGQTIWPLFVDKAMDLSKPSGFIAAIHPVAWRKPNNSMFPKMTSKTILYLSLNSKKTGLKTFGASTPYDWYIMQNSNSSNSKNTTVAFYDGVEEVNLSKIPFLPNCEFKLFLSLLAKGDDEKCDLLWGCKYHSQNCKHLSKNESRIHKFPVIHQTGKNGVILRYSSKKSDFFNIPKVIFGESDVIANSILDIDGNYAMTECSMAIGIKSQREGAQLQKALESEKFTNMLQNSFRWSQFRIDYRMFRYFRRDFWKEFI